MIDLDDLIEAEIANGYGDENAQAKVCQDIILKAISDGSLSKNVTMRQQDYKGKRVFIEISDTFGNKIPSKIDLGVHTKLDIKQEEFCFDIAFDDNGASLLINSNEQMFTEKLRSLLRFGAVSTRYKDIFDMYYLCGHINRKKVEVCLKSYIFDAAKMREKDIAGVLARCVPLRKLWKTQ